MDPRPSNQTSSQLFRELFAAFCSLFHAEVHLAKVELNQSVRAVRRDAIRATVFGGTALLGVFSLLAFVVMGLGELLGGLYWLSALLIGAALFVGGSLAAYFSMKKMEDSTSPQVATNNLRADREMIAQKVRDISSIPTGSHPEESPSHARRAARRLRSQPPEIKKDTAREF